MGLGGDPERRPFDGLADIKLNNGLTLATGLYYYQHALTYRDTQTTEAHGNTSIHTDTYAPR